MTIFVPIDNNNNIVDKEPALKSFEYAGQILAGLWSKLIINDHPAVAEFFWEEPLYITITNSKEWKTSHACELQYLL